MECCVFVLFYTIEGITAFMELIRKIHRHKGCRCRKCGKIRDVEHDWKGCVCYRCGKTRDIDEHDWKGCQCKRCGKTDKYKPDEAHFWVGCKCWYCGKIRDIEHDLDGCRCKRCGTVCHDGYLYKSVFEGCGGGEYWPLPDEETNYYRCRRCGAEWTKTSQY